MKSRNRKMLCSLLPVLSILLAAYLLGNLTARLVWHCSSQSVSSPVEKITLPHYGPATAIEEKTVSNPYDPISAMENTAGSSWGLGFSTEGERPTGNATIEQLAAFHAHYAADTDEKKLYLTFDAGYENGNTAPILDALEKHSAPAVFFVVGTYIESNRELIRRMDEMELITVGNHTYSHPDMSKISTREAFSEELSRVEELYRNATGSELARFYRPPQGIYSEANLAMADELGYHTFFWSLAYVDWKQDAQPTREQAFEKLLRRVHPGAIVLLHSTSSTNAAILDELLSKWEEMGYRFAPLSELAA